MKIEDYYFTGDKPLDRILPDGGFCAIFRRIACIGDSLSSGEFETLTPDGKKHYNDMFEYSWGQFIARMCGSKVYNFSKGGMTAKNYCEKFAEEKGYWDPALAAQAYIIAMGCNDLNHNRFAVGSVGDICDEDYTKNADTYAGWYGRMVQRYREISPDAKFFFVTMPRSGREERDRTVAAQAQLMRDLADHFPNSYVIDLERYAPVYDDSMKPFYLLGHLNPCGYIFTAKIIASYIDWIVRHNMDDFKRVGYIGTELADSKLRILEAEAAAAAAAADKPQA